MADRLGEYYSIGPWWLRLSIVVGPWGWAGSAYYNRRLLWLRPIDYAAADRAGPYKRKSSHILSRVRMARANVRKLAVAIYRGETFTTPTKESDRDD